KPPTAPVVAAIPARPPRPPRPDLETLVGRYGMLALATVLALTAVGTFVGWAIRHGLLGPVPRALLGLAPAAAIGTWAFNRGLRRRGPDRGRLRTRIARLDDCRARLRCCCPALRRCDRRAPPDAAFGRARSGVALRRRCARRHSLRAGKSDPPAPAHAGPSR